MCKLAYLTRHYIFLSIHVCITNHVYLIICCPQAIFLSEKEKISKFTPLSIRWCKSINQNELTFDHKPQNVCIKVINLQFLELNANICVQKEGGISLECVYISRNMLIIFKARKKTNNSSYGRARSVHRSHNLFSMYTCVSLFPVD